MQGLKIGHFTDQENGTGLSVFLFENSAVGAYLLSGSGPASHELATLDLENSVRNLHGLLLSGGSVLGLCAVKGIVQYLIENEIGLTLPHGVIPIVPAAAIYDLSYKKALAPTAESAYKACLSAKENNTDSGRIGAGCGAVVGKLVPNGHPMTGGLGRAEISLSDGLMVTAYAVVNAVGDICNQEGKIIAGARDSQHEFIDCEKYLLSGAGEAFLLEHGRHTRSNTTLAAVFTNAKLTKSELKRVSKMAIAGLARAITPVFTCYDGDILFSISLGDLSASVMTVGVLAAEAVRLAVLNAVTDSEII